MRIHVVSALSIDVLITRERKVIEIIIEMLNLFVVFQVKEEMFGKSC